MPVNPSELKLFKLLEKRAKVNPPKSVNEQTIAEFRAGCDIFFEFAGKPSDVAFKNESVPARDGYQIPIRIYNPTGKEVLIFYPGCGYIDDLFESNAIACSRIAKHGNIKVIIINFRLAPENPFPTPIYDAYDATKYIATHAKHFNINPERIFIGGISSGANSAAVISNLATKNKEFKVHHQILCNGCYDLTESSHDYDTFEAEDKICVRKEVTPFIFAQYGLKKEEFKDPLYSPYFAKDLTGLPPSTFIISEYDGLRNDSEAYYEKLKAAGNKVKKIILPGQTHNTLIMRGAMIDGEDPAKIFAEVVNSN